MTVRVEMRDKEYKLNAYGYGDIRALKAAFKNMVRLEQQAIYGSDSAALTIISDLQRILERDQKVLTERQREVVMLVLVEDLTEEVVGGMLGISQQSVHYRLKGGLNRIREYLLTGNIRKDLSLCEEQNKRLIEMYSQGYSNKEIAIELKIPIRRVLNKINVMRKKKRLGNRGKKGAGYNEPTQV